MKNYQELVKEVLVSGYGQEGRNGRTVALFGKQLEYNLEEGFPIVTGRKIFYRGVAGELAALLKGPKHVDDFKEQGCSYWNKFADADGKLRLAYGNAWRDFNGANQLEYLIKNLKENPGSRRHLLVAWDPANLDNLSSHCCHYAYEWFVRDGRLDMIWIQRSVDLLVGLPSDIILGAMMNMVIASTVGLKPGRLTLQLGNCHIYTEHLFQVADYLRAPLRELPIAKLAPEATIDNFVPDMFSLKGYVHGPTMRFELKL